MGRGLRGLRFVKELGEEEEEVMEGWWWLEG